MSNFPIGPKSSGGRTSRDFDIFEELPDGEIIWRARVHGIENVELKVREMSGDSKTKFFAISLRGRSKEEVIEAFMPGRDRDKFVS